MKPQTFLAFGLYLFAIVGLSASAWGQLDSALLRPSIDEPTPQSLDGSRYKLRPTTPRRAPTPAASPLLDEDSEEAKVTSTPTPTPLTPVSPTLAPPPPPPPPRPRPRPRPERLRSKSILRQPIIMTALPATSRFAIITLEARVIV